MYFCRCLNRAWFLCFLGEKLSISKSFGSTTFMSLGVKIHDKTATF